MKIEFAFFLFFFLPLFLSAQKNNEYRKYTRYHFKHIEWNGQEYNNNFSGIRTLLNDMEKVDPVLHLILERDLKKYKREKRNGNLAIGGGILIGGFFLMGAALESFTQGEDESVNAKKRKVNSLSMGGLFSIVLGAGLGAVIKPSNSRKFIYGFTKRINDNTNIHKATYTLNPSLNLGNNPSIGLSFSVNF